MPRAHDQFACPVCLSARTRSMDMIAMTGTRYTRGSKSRATIGARGWWSLSDCDYRGISQSMLAKRIAPQHTTSLGGILVASAVIYAIFGSVGIAAILSACLLYSVWPGRGNQESFLCLRCGHKFDPFFQANSSDNFSSEEKGSGFRSKR